MINGRHPMFAEKFGVMINVLMYWVTQRSESLTNVFPTVVVSQRNNLNVERLNRIMKLIDYFLIFFFEIA
jgi:hypothetical protein